MSIIKKGFSLATLICAQLLISALMISGQDLEANLEINLSSPAVIQVKGKLLRQSSVNWFFLKSIANADNLGARVSHFELAKQNQIVPVKKMADGEYLANNAGATDFRYQINLEPLPNAATRAHASWISDGQGILMLDDLLPQFSTNNSEIAAKIRFKLPNDWKIISNENSGSENFFTVENIAKAVFVVGLDWRETKTEQLNLAISGEWRFSDIEATLMANEIYTEYTKLFGENRRMHENHRAPAQIVLARLPKTAKFGRWEAETRGKTLTILSADKPFKSQSIQLLHEQLRHEIFHLWMPNDLNLDGNYDWFYEGFTIYQSLRTGLKMNQIRFEDFLATLAEAYNLDNFQIKKVSLLESSKNRFNGANSQVYARGMIVAFLCEAAILNDNKSRRSLDDVFQEIYRKHRYPNEKANGNAAILRVLSRYAPLNSIIKKYVEGTEKIHWETDLEAFGIEMNAEDSFVKLEVKAKLNSRQKDLLNKLGYNNWRKIPKKLK